MNDLCGDNNVGRVVGDVTSVGAVRESDEPGLSPGGAPLVAHLPVAPGRGVHAHGLHAVVHVLAAAGDDAALVRVPGGGVQGLVDAEEDRRGGRSAGGAVQCQRRLRIGDTAVRTSVVAATIARFFASCASSSARSGVGAFETVTGAAGVGTGSSVSHTSRSSRVIGGLFSLSARSTGKRAVVEILETTVSFAPPKLNPLTAIVLLPTTLTGFGFAALTPGTPTAIPPRPQ